MDLEANGRSWFDVEADELLDEFQGMSADRLASDLEANAEAYDGFETALSVASALRRRTIPGARGQAPPPPPAASSIAKAAKPKRVKPAAPASDLLC